MIDIKFDFSQFERAVEGISGGIEQLPYVLSVAMNEAAFTTRRQLVEQTWPSHVTVRNARFMNAALRVEKASKNNLVVSITDAGAPGRARLKQHDEGGTKIPKGSKLAIPTDRVRRTAKGVSARQRPQALPNTFRKGDALYQRTGKGGRKLKLMFVLKPSAKQPADVPFSRDFHDAMAAAMRESFPKAMARALSKRK